MLVAVTPTPRGDAPLLSRAGNRLLHLVEDLIYAALAVLLSVAAVVVIVQTTDDLISASDDEDTSGILDVLDGLLLVFILVELLFAVRITLQKREIVAEPFLLVGILAAIKEIVVLSVTAANDYVGKGPEFARAMVEIGLLGGLVLLLAGSIVLLRKKETEPEEGSAGRRGTRRRGPERDA
jgi:uncharacterized membrane protein (DUF373 family)